MASIKPRPANLHATLSSLLARRKTESRLRDLKAFPPDSVDLSSNDFLSLSTSTSIRNAYLNKLQDQSHLFSLGSTGSRLLDGNSLYAEGLESDLSRFYQGQAGLLANSGFDANVGIFSCVPQPGDVVVYDELIHASVHDGIKLSRARKTISFNHNSTASLREVLQDCLSEDTGLANGHRNVFVAVESVYSMEGTLAPLSEIVQLLDDLFPHQNAHLIVDEAHATGIYGSKGRGRVCEAGLQEKVLIRLHTFGKALACSGAIIVSSPTIRTYLINYARPLIYTTFMPFPSLALIEMVHSAMKEGKTEARATRLFELIRYLYDSLRSLRMAEDLVEIPAACPTSPIFALITPHPRNLAQACQDAGFVARAVVAPTVPVGTERVRVCLHAGNTFEQIDGFVGVVQRWIDLQRAHISSRSETSEPLKARL